MAIRVTGRVTDAVSSAPIGGARVTLMLVVDTPEGTFGHRPRQSITDVNGAFAFDSVAEGQYQLKVEKTGFASYPDIWEAGPPKRVIVGDHDEDPRLQIALKKGAVVAGRILNANGEPEADLQVSAFKRTDKAGPLGFAQTGHGPTNDLGEFRIAGLPSGDYVIHAAAHRHGGPFDSVQTGPTTLAPTFFPGVLDQSEARVVTVTAGQTVAGIDFSIATVAAFRLSGVVLDPSGRPSPRAIVTLIPQLTSIASFMSKMAMAADDGTFEIGEVVPGTYRIQADVNEAASSEDGGGVFGFSFVSDFEVPPSGPGTVTVSSADISGVTVVANRR
jgi:hypothetical protein